MKIKKFNDNHYIITTKKDLYFTSYDSIICKIKDSQILGKEKIFFSKAWSYSQTTLKNLYEFLELHSTIRIGFYNNTLCYELMRSKSKKDFLNELIKNKIILIKNEEDL